jgi:protein-L-isoaspartate(D-aspartate) O-methyltransferase
MTKDSDFARAREKMVDEQLIPRRISNPRVLSAMRHVPRHRFVNTDLQHLAYEDAPLPIGQRQTISQPYIVALMTQLLELAESDKVLEVGTGSGYQAAVLAQLAAEIISVERISLLAERARQIFEEIGINNVKIIESDGSMGNPEFAPYNAIIVTAAAPQVPQPLKDQLADGGRMVLPVGGRDGQVLERWRRDGERLESERITPVAFVPLVGNFGWDEDGDINSWWWG